MRDKTKTNNWSNKKNSKKIKKKSRKNKEEDKWCEIRFKWNDEIIKRIWIISELNDFKDQK